MVENGMTTCLPVRSALTQKGRSWWLDVIVVQLPLTSPLTLYLSPENLVYQIFYKYQPSARGPAQKFRHRYERCIYISCVLLVDQFSTTTTSYN